MGRRAALLLLLTAGGLAGCGGDSGGPAAQRFDLVTPPDPARTPVASATPRQPTLTAKPRTEPRPTQRDAERLRPVIAAWARAVRRGDAKRAAGYFKLPAIVSQTTVREISEDGEMQLFNASLSCGARLLEVQHDGRYVVGTFRLVPRKGFICTSDGALVRVGFVFEGRRFSEWWQVPDERGAKPGPEHRPQLGSSVGP
jgi:hypothetical protein